jgi:hypothetical protein
MSFSSHCRALRPGPFAIVLEYPNKSQRRHLIGEPYLIENIAQPEVGFKRTDSRMQSALAKHRRLFPGQKNISALQPSAWLENH